MNGRVYDPLLGRFGKPAPMTESPFSTQGWNRYSYVGNSPVNFTDPSGYCFMGCFWQPAFQAIGNFFRQCWRVVLNITVTGLCHLATGPNPGCAAFGSFVAGMTSGNLGQAVRSAVIAFVTAAAFDAVGTATLGPGHKMPDLLSPKHLANMAGHALVGCVSAAAQGRRCGPGALSAAAGSFAGPILRDLGFHRNLVAHAVVGGIASVAGGGNFANGAITAAYGYLFNALGDLPPAPPGYNSATWRYAPFIDELNVIDHRLIDPEGRIWRAHPEDVGHWRHWDARDPNDPDGGGGNQDRWPEKSKKPWPTQIRAPYGDQSGSDPSGNAPQWQPPSQPSIDPFIGIMPPFGPGTLPIFRMPLVPVFP